MVLLSEFTKLSPSWLFDIMFSHMMFPLVSNLRPVVLSTKMFCEMVLLYEEEVT